MQENVYFEEIIVPGGGGSYGIAYWQAAYIEILGIGGFLQLSASIRRRI